jgi:hypothetical protein
VKQTEVKVGEVYLTRVSGLLVKVRVTLRSVYGTTPKKTRFWLERVDNGKKLFKPRSGAALHPYEAKNP